MHWKLKGRVAGSLLLATMFVSANLNPNAGSATAGDPVLSYPETASTTQETATPKRRTIDRFLALATETNGTSLQGASAKIAVSDHSGNPGFLWVSTLENHDGNYIGRTTGTEIAAITFRKDQIRDWSFIGRDGKVYGNYTTRALLPSLQPQQATQIAIALSATPTPQGW